MSRFARAFLSDSPGVVAATVTPLGGLSSELLVQWWRESSRQSMQYVDLGGLDSRLVAESSAVADLSRGDGITVKGNAYTITAIDHDDHGMATLYVEPA